MERNTEVRDGIIKTMLEKSQLKQVVYDNTKEAFTILKKVLHDIVIEYNGILKDADDRIKLEYRDRGLPRPRSVRDRNQGCRRPADIQYALQHFRIPA